GEYLVYSTGLAPLPFPTVIAILGNELANTMVFALALICLLFPTGAPPSRHWRWVLWVWGSALVVGAAWTLIRPGVIWGAEDRVRATIAGPFSPPAWLTATMVSIAAVGGIT